MVQERALIVNIKYIVKYFSSDVICIVLVIGLYRCDGFMKSGIRICSSLFLMLCFTALCKV